MSEIEDKVKSAINDTQDTTDEYTKEDMEKNKTMAILSYILPFIPYFAEKESKWVRYHAVQGMNLLILSIAVSVISAILSTIVGWRLWWLVNTVTSLCSLGIFVLAVLGIVNVCNGKAKELPVVNKFKIFK